jgi:serine phosphatase RsbU (regulator of sigma subunit)
MDEVVRGLGDAAFTITAVLARWHAPTATLSWINCGHPPGWVVDPDDGMTLLAGPEHPPLGVAGAPDAWIVTTTRLEAGDRFVLVTNGVLEREVTGGGVFGAGGVQAAVEQAAAPTAAATALAIQQAVARAWTEPLADDATLLVLAVD